jgi:hypothetical protein
VNLIFAIGSPFFENLNLIPKLLTIPFSSTIGDIKFNFKNGVNLPASRSRVSRLDEVACGINFVAGLIVLEAKQAVLYLAVMCSEKKVPR